MYDIHVHIHKVHGYSMWTGEKFYIATVHEYGCDWWSHFSDSSYKVVYYCLWWVIYDWWDMLSPMECSTNGKLTVFISFEYCLNIILQYWAVSSTAAQQGCTTYGPRAAASGSRVCSPRDVRQYFVKMARLMFQAHIFC